MRIEEWDARYRTAERAEDFSTAPTPLVIEAARTSRSIAIKVPFWPM